jgi:hypothetical protein
MHRSQQRWPEQRTARGKRRPQGDRVRRSWRPVHRSEPAVVEPRWTHPRCFLKCRILLPRRHATCCCCPPLPPLRIPRSQRGWPTQQDARASASRSRVPAGRLRRRTPPRRYRHSASARSWPATRSGHLPCRGARHARASRARARARPGVRRWQGDRGSGGKRYGPKGCGRTRATPVRPRAPAAGSAWSTRREEQRRKWPGEADRALRSPWREVSTNPPRGPRSLC